MLAIGRRIPRIASAFVLVAMLGFAPVQAVLAAGAASNLKLLSIRQHPPIRLTRVYRCALDIRYLSHHPNSMNRAAMVEPAEAAPWSIGSDIASRSSCQGRSPSKAMRQVSNPSLPTSYKFSTA